MKTSTLPFAGAIALLSLTAHGADGLGSDPLTKLALPAEGAPLALFASPNTIENVPVCSAKSTMNMYSVRSGSVSAAVAWYTSHLTGFKHVHGYGSGRSQDTFYNSAGTLLVSITGRPDKEGQDTKVYSVIYATIQPGVSEKTIAGMNVQKVACP